MANQEHLKFIEKILKSGNSSEWNQWRASKYRIDEVYGYMSLVKVDLSNADLRGLWSFSYLDLADVNFRHVNLEQANFHSGNLRRADLRQAGLSHADLRRSILDGANLSRANLRYANLGASSLADVNLSGADLYGANLAGARLQRTNLKGANISECEVYGVSAWDVKLDKTIQSRLSITPPGQSTVRVGNLEMAQFIYMLLDHKKIRDVITTTSERVVLILGRFTKERKEVLEAIDEKLKELGYLPVIFDFEKIPGQDYTETVKVLAGLSKFVIADITHPKSVPQESQAIIPDFKIPFVRVIQKGARVWSMSKDLDSYDWVVKEIIEYPNKTALIKNLTEVVKLVELKYTQLQKKKAENTLKILPIEKLDGSD